MAEEKYPGWEQVQFVPQRDLATMTEKGWRLLETDSHNETVLIGKKRDDRIEELKAQRNEAQHKIIDLEVELQDLRASMRSDVLLINELKDNLELARKNQRAMAVRVDSMEKALQRYEVLIGAMRNQYGQKALDELMELPPLKIIYPEHKADDPKIKELVKKYAESDAVAAQRYVADLKSRQKLSGTTTGRMSSKRPNYSNRPRSINTGHAIIANMGDDIDDM